MFQAVCGCGPIAMPGSGWRNEITVRTKLQLACCSGVAGKITNVTRLRDPCVDGARQMRRFTLKNFLSLKGALTCGTQNGTILVSYHQKERYASIDSH